MGSLPKVGKCGPISNAYNATLVASCNKILDPFVSIPSSKIINTLPVKMPFNLFIFIYRLVEWILGKRGMVSDPLHTDDSSVRKAERFVSEIRSLSRATSRSVSISLPLDPIRIARRISRLSSSRKLQFCHSVFQTSVRRIIIVLITFST